MLQDNAVIDRACLPADHSETSDSVPECGGLVTLLELLRFYADRFSFATRLLSDLLFPLSIEKSTPKWMRPIPIPGVGIAKNMRLDGAEVREKLEKMKGALADCDVPVSIQHISQLIAKTSSEHPVTFEDVLGLQDNIDRELRTRIFFTVPYGRREAFDEPRKGWEAIIGKFRDAADDVEEMNKCFALSRYTAAVFHSLLVVEHGLVALGKYIGVTDPKPGWDATSKKLKAIVQGGRTSLPAGLDFNFLDQTNSRVESMKMAWRNRVNHAGGRLFVEKSGFTDFASEEVILACRSFMRHLAEGL
jgi:hypothetical protein